MFYKVVALALVMLGVVYIGTFLSIPFDYTPDSLEKSAIGLSTIFLGLLNLGYVYETPGSKVPKIVLFTANLLFIGFTILLVTSKINVYYGYTAMALSLINCMMAINHKV